MLFSNIAALARRGVKIHISVEAVGDDRLEVLVSPSLADPARNKTGVDLVPRSFQGRPEEFDAEFPAILASFATATLDLQAQLEAASQLITQAGKAASEAAVQAAAKPSQGKAASRPIKAPAAAKPQLLGDDEADDDHEASEEEGGLVSGGEAAPPARGHLEITL